MQKNPGKMITMLAGLQQRVSVIQKEIAAEIFEGRASNGLVILRVTGKGEFLSVFIDPSLLSEDADTIGALVIAAGNQAHQSKEAFSKAKLATISSGLLPLGMKVSDFG
ncbi:MAG: YbaB/EbfC family nucleoid-associated protein [Agitococcus sp.]|nr:YbaB/EbfC family nucleoid-associated protein [Agitococcus sp.]MDO9177062.1 YbaB/EbfC family nucleoid-associated protein [Agitococcus sp.]